MSLCLGLLSNTCLITISKFYLNYVNTHCFSWWQFWFKPCAKLTKTHYLEVSARIFWTTGSRCCRRTLWTFLWLVSGAVLQRYCSTVCPSSAQKSIVRWNIEQVLQLNPSLIVVWFQSGNIVTVTQAIFQSAQLIPQLPSVSRAISCYIAVSPGSRRPSRGSHLTLVPGTRYLCIFPGAKIYTVSSTWWRRVYFIAETILLLEKQMISDV